MSQNNEHFHAPASSSTGGFSISGQANAKTGPAPALIAAHEYIGENAGAGEDLGVMQNEQSTSGLLELPGIQPEPTCQATEAENTCQLNVEPFFQCCCTCIYHKPVHHHCCTSPGMREKHGGCCCGVQKGWACVAPEFGRVYDNWPEHSCGCEMHTERKAKEAAQ